MMRENRTTSGNGFRLNTWANSIGATNVILKKNTLVLLPKRKDQVYRTKHGGKLVEANLWDATQVASIVRDFGLGLLNPFELN